MKTGVCSTGRAAGLTLLLCVSLFVASCAPAQPLPKPTEAKPAPAAAPAAPPSPSPAASPAAIPSPAPAVSPAVSPAASPPPLLPAPSVAGATGPRDRLSVRMGFTWSSGQYYSMFLLGRDKGIYSKHGMDVEMGEGQGSASTAQIIANKQADFAIAVDPGSVIRAVVSGARIKMVGQNVPVAPIAVLSKASNRISTPQELVGKRIGLPPGTTQSQLFPAFLRANNIEASSINIVNVQAAAMQAALAQGQLDGFVSFAHSQLPILSSMGVEGHAMLFSDFGLKFAPGEGIIVHEDTIRSNPDLVRRFVAATEETLRYAIDNVEEAADAGVKAVPDAIRKDVAVAQIQYEADLIKRDRVAGRPIVAMQAEDWRALIELLVQYAELQNPGPPTDYFTNDFVPTS